MNPKHPILTEYEEGIFRRFFVSRFKAGWHTGSVQLEGDGRLPVVAAGIRLEKKGVVIRSHSCHWYLTDLGNEMALERKPEKAKR